MPLLSVIVPFYNVEQFIAPCLESLRRQTLADFEVVLVDDGSPDGTRAVVEEYCARDPRFRLITQENQGLGPARNTGVTHANGEYLTFVDSDDVVRLHAYERYTESLQRTGSDFAIARAERFSTFGVAPSAVHELAILGDRERAHITTSKELVLDRMAWNKVYRRSFWDENGFGFPAMLMEDFPVSVAAHTRAEAVDLIFDRLYGWRERDGGEASITQRSAEIGNVTDRFNSAIMVLDVIEPHAPDSVRMLRRHFTEVDVTAITGALTANHEDAYPALLDLSQRLVDRLGPDAEAASKPFYKVQTALVRAGDVEGLLDLHRYQYRYGKDAVVQRRGRFGGRIGKRYVEAFPALDRATVTETPFLLKHGRPQVGVSVDDIEWTGSSYRVELLVHAPLPLGERTRMRLWLEAPDGVRIPCETTRETRVRPHVGEDLVGLRTEVDPRTFTRQTRPARGFWAFRVEIDGPDVETVTAVSDPSHGRGRYVTADLLPGRPDLMVQPYRRDGHGFGFMVRRPHTFVTAIAPTPAGLRLEGWFQAPSTADGGPPPVRLQVQDRGGATTEVAVPDLRADGDRTAFAVELPAAGLLAPTDYHDPVASQRNFHVRLVVGEDVRVLALEPGFSAVTTVQDARMLTASMNVGGNLELVEQRTAPELVAARWVAADRLRFEGRWLGAEPLGGTADLEHFEHPAEGIRVSVPLTRDGDGYAFEVDVAELTRVQTEEKEPFQGSDARPWHLVLTVGGRRTTQALDRTELRAFAPPRTVAGRRVEVLCTRNDVVRLNIGG